MRLLNVRKLLNSGDEVPEAGSEQAAVGARVSNGACELTHHRGTA